MSNVVSWVIELSVKPENQAKFEQLMREMVAATRKEPGALIYEWFRSGDAVHIYERYADSAATMVHLGNFGQHFAERFMALAAVTRFSVYGPANDDVRGAVGGLGAGLYETFGGFAR